MRKNILPELITAPKSTRAKAIRRNRGAAIGTSSRFKAPEKNTRYRSVRLLHSESILVPIDFTTASYQALDYAVSMAKRLNVSVTLVHVVLRTYSGGLVDANSKMNLRAVARREAQRKLDALAFANSRADLSVRSIVCDGLLEYEILRIAEKIQAKMIVLGRQQRSPFSRLIFGSVTRDILDLARCPVLVINSGMDSDRPKMRRTFSTN